MPARVSPKAGSGLAQYRSPRNLRGGLFAESSRQATSRGQRRQATTSRSTLRKLSRVRSAPGVLAHQGGLGQDVPLHRALHVRLGGAGGELELPVERIDLEHVAMRAARRAGAAVPDLPE